MSTAHAPSSTEAATRLWIQEHHDQLRRLYESTWWPKMQAVMAKRAETEDESMDVSEYVCYHMQWTLDVLQDALDPPKGWMIARGLINDDDKDHGRD